MAETNDLIGIRKILKRKKPKFHAQDSQKTKRVSKRWRRPRGSDSKMRLNIAGYRKGVSIGWRSPKVVRGLSRDGKEMFTVYSIKDVSKANKENQVIIISSSVGTKKKIEIVKEAMKQGKEIMGIKDNKLFIEKMEKKLAEQRQIRADKKKTKEQKIKEREKKSEEKEKKDKLAEKIESEEGKKEAEKKEKDKLLIKEEK